MSKFLLISIHPEFVDKILSGEKVFEFRKTLPSATVTHLAIYATSPVKAIVAVAEVENTITDSPDNLWKRTNYGAGIAQRHYSQYFSDLKVANAFHLGRVFHVKGHLTLKQICPRLMPPQSYRYLDDADFNKISRHLNKKPIKHRKLIFLGGVHGVGKSTLCKNLFLPAGYYCVTASELIKDAGGAVRKDKKVSALDDNQAKLITQLSRIRNSYARFLLDGHFTLINSHGHIVPIPIHVFRKIRPNVLILLTETPNELAGRLNARDGKKWSLSLIKTFQEQELKHARSVAFELKIPLHHFQNGVSPIKQLVVLRQE
jgi:adenylate kinase